jgi:ATP-binding cassette subfamily F protein uup
MRYAGNYDDYREVKARTEKRNSSPPQRTSSPPPPPQAKEREKEKVAAPRAKPLSYAERIELDGILEAIEKADAAVIAAEGKLADPSLYTGRTHEVPRLQAALDRAKADAARLTTRWEELETKRDASTRT